MRSQSSRSLITAAAVAILLILPACAAKGVRNQTRVGALTVGEAAIAIDQAERQVAAANVPGYDASAQKQVGAGILKVLHAARAYERAAASWQENGPVPEQISAAKVGISQALDDLVAVTPSIEGVRSPLLKAIEVLRAALAAASADAGHLPVVRAQALPPQIMGLFALANLFVGLVSSGRTTFEKLKAALQKEGATEEELAALDVQLSDAIARREAEQAGANESGL